MALCTYFHIKLNNNVRFRKYINAEYKLFNIVRANTLRASQADCKNNSVEEKVEWLYRFSHLVDLGATIVVDSQDRLRFPPVVDFSAKSLF